jgi:putative inorganic carbon (HCO3(-)) transporter
LRSTHRLADLVVRYEILAVAAIVVGLIFSTHLPAGALALLLLLVPLIWLCRRLAEGRVVAVTPLNFPILLTLVMVLPALYATADMELSLLGVYRIVAGLAIFYALTSYARSWERLEWLVLIALAAGGALAIAGLLDTRFSANKVLPLSGLYRFLPKTSLPIMAAAGANANIVGGTLAMLAPVGLAMLVFPAVPRRLKVVAWPSTALMLLTVLLSQSRGAWMGLAASVLVVAALRDRRALVAIPVSLLGVALVIGRYGTHTIAEALLQSSTIPSAAGRMEIWQRAVYMMQDFPFTGVGLGMYGRVAAILYPFFLISPDSNVPHAHNVFLQAAVDLGIPGLVAFVGLLTVFVVAMLHVWWGGAA